MLGITSKIKFLGNTFFIWAVPLTILVLNVLNQRDVFNQKLFVGILLGIFINLIWKMIFSLIDSYQLKVKDNRFYKLI